MGYKWMFNQCINKVGDIYLLIMLPPTIQPKFFEFPTQIPIDQTPITHNLNLSNCSPSSKPHNSIDNNERAKSRANKFKKHHHDETSINLHPIASDLQTPMNKLRPKVATKILSDQFNHSQIKQFSNTSTDLISNMIKDRYEAYVTSKQKNTQPIFNSKNTSKSINQEMSDQLTRGRFTSCSYQKSPKHPNDSLYPSNSKQELLSHKLRIRMNLNYSPKNPRLRRSLTRYPDKPDKPSPSPSPSPSPKNQILNRNNITYSKFKKLKQEDFNKLISFYDYEEQKKDREKAKREKYGIPQNYPKGSTQEKWRASNYKAINGSPYRHQYSLLNKLQNMEKQSKEQVREDSITKQQDDQYNKLSQYYHSKYKSKSTPKKIQRQITDKNNIEPW